jgi:dUTP pyrophosphatase
MKVDFIKIDPNAELPRKAHSGDACFDINALWFEKKDFTVICHTGLKCNVPAGYEMQVRSRSGMAASGVFVVNSPGCVDSGYNGEIMVILGSITGQAPYLPSNKWSCKVANMDLQSGSRVAQICFVPVVPVQLVEAFEVVESDRGESGIGSTGILESLDAIDSILKEDDDEDTKPTAKDSGVST